MKRIAILSLLVLICSTIFAQKKAAIAFKETTYNFGTFDEEKGKVTTEFEFTNTGNGPLLITRTAASCGCTTPEYPKEPIAPGKSGVIRVTFNAKGRPGSFQKTVYVFANTEPEKTSLIIKGHVNPRKTTKEDSFPRQIGMLRMKDKNVVFYDVYPGIPKTQSLPVFNDGTAPMSLNFYDVPKHVKIKMEPATLEAGKEGRIEITYFAEKAKDWGKRRDEFKIEIKGEKRDEIINRVTLSADIREDFSDMTEEDIANAPVYSIDNKFIDFGPIKGKVSRSLTIRNTGKSDLIIRSIKNEYQMLDVEIDHKTIAPGKSATVKVTIIPEKTEDKYINNLIYIIANDPENPSNYIKIVGSVD